MYPATAAATSSTGAAEEEEEEEGEEGEEGEGGATRDGRVGDLLSLDEDAGPSLRLAPRNVAAALLTPTFLRPADDEESAVLETNLSVDRLTMPAFIRGHFLTRLREIPARARNRFALEATRSLPSLTLIDRGVADALARAPFVPTPSGQLAAPMHLYDPRVHELVELLDASASFPSAPFDDDAALDGLHRLGLRTTVTRAAVLDAAMAAERLLEEGDGDGAAARGAAVLRYLETPDGARLLAPETNAAPGAKVKKMFGKVFGGKSATKEGGKHAALGSESAAGDALAASAPPELPRDAFVAALSSIAWVPVATTPLSPREHPGLPWPSDPPATAPPRSTRPPSDAWLCSASMRVLTREPQSASLADALGWRAPLSPAVLADQLCALGEAHAVVADAAVGRALAAAVPRVYALMTAALNHADFAAAERKARTRAVVWVGTGFARVDAVAFAGALDLAPYLHVLPADLTCFRPLLTALGVRDAFAPRDYVGLLRRLALDRGATPLDARALDLSLWVLGVLADRPHAQWTGEIERDGALPVPDVGGVLRGADDVRFNDAPWLHAPEGVTLSHPKLPSSTAEAVGVRSLRLALLAESSEDIGVHLHGTAQAFGQSEALTTRLKHILDAYADGPGVISELVQNADDAGASEVRLMLDMRTGGSKSLLAPKLERWQGPALVAWNDAVFSPADFHNIARIGQDSKVDRPAAAGRFGLGFNAIYHFTDLPSFVSGEYLVMFDPHATHLPGATAARPGLKIAFADSPLLRQFPDQFSTYRGHFGCDLSKAYDATLFRFPLRTETAAKSSEIKPEAYTVDAVLALFEQFRSRAAQTLLFLKNVRKISVYERDADADEPTLLYEASIPSFQDGKDPRATVLQWVAGDVSLGRDDTSASRATVATSAVKKSAFADKLRAMPESSLPSSVGWMDLVVRQRQRGGSLCDSKERWMVSSSLAGGRARALALSEAGVTRGLVPWVGVAARVPHPETSDDATSSETVDGRAFCFLPLPVKTGLPVHVNAYFELSSNRRDIWFGGDMSGGGAARSEWNGALLADAVAPAYASLIAAAATSLGPRAAYYSLFPTNTSLPQPWSLVLSPLFAALSGLPCVRAIDPTADARLLASSSSSWVAPRAAFFPDPSVETPPDLAAALRAVGVRLIDGAPADVSAAFATHCPSVARRMSPAAARAILKDAKSMRRHPALDDSAHVVALLRYCVSDVDASDAATAADLDGVPLIPLANGARGAFAARGGVRGGDDDAEEEGGRSETYYFMPRASEMSLLRPRASDVLVDRDVLGESLARALTDIVAGATGKALNVRAIDAPSLQYLMPKILPPEWRGGGGCGGGGVAWNADGSDGHPTASTLALLWTRFAAISPKSLAHFEGWPLLPVGGGCARGGARLATLTPHGPLVRGEGWTDSGRDALDALGVSQLAEGEVSDAATTHPAIAAYVRPASASGVLDAAVAAAALDPETRAARANDDGSPPTAEQRWRAAASAVPARLDASADAAARRALRAFLMQRRWYARDAVGGKVEGARLDLVRSLPIFETRGENEKTNEISASAASASASASSSSVVATAFARLDATPPPLLAPAGANVSLLTSSFLKVDDDAAADLLETSLGAPRATVATTFAEHVLPALALRRLPPSLARDALDAALDALARSKASWTGGGDADALVRALRSCACVPTRSGALAKPGALFDAENSPSLLALLDPAAHFAAPPFDSGERAAALRALGVRASLGAEGLVHSARSVERLAATAATTPAAIARGAALLAHLNALARATAAGGTDLPPAGAMLESESGSDGSATPARSLWRELGSISWCVVMTSPPHPSLPWPNRDDGGKKAMRALAPPRATRPPDDAWLASSCMRILDLSLALGVEDDEDVVVEEATEAAAAPPTPTPAGLTLAVSPEESFSRTDDGRATAGSAREGVSSVSPPTPTLEPLLVDLLGWNALSATVVAAQLLELGKAHAIVDRDSELAREFNARLPRAYAQLAAAAGVGSESSSSELEAAATILDSARWLWHGGGFAASVDVAIDCPGDFRPYLHGVPYELSSHVGLLRALGVRGRFDAADYARAARAVADDANGAALSEERVALAVALAEAAAESLLAPPDDAEGDGGDGDPYPSPPDVAAAAKAKAKTMPSSAVVGTFMLPDGAGVMAPASALVHNDAEWLLGGGDAAADDDDDDAKTRASSGGVDVSALRLTHPSVPCAIAEALGARSLRALYAVDKSSTDRLPCPSAATLRRLLPAYDDRAHAFSDVAEVADVVCARGLEISLDLKTYKSRSLLLPQLAQFQGPAVTIRLPGVSLAADEIATLLTAAAPFKLRKRAIRFGNGFVSCAHFSDVFTAATAGQLCVFDPTGVALGGGGGGSSGAKRDERAAGGSAKAYSYGANGELATRFADQFAPFVAAGLDPSRGSGLAADSIGTVIRVPLRTRAQAARASALSSRAFDVDDAWEVRSMLETFAASAHKVLLFAASLSHVRVTVRNAPREDDAARATTRDLDGAMKNADANEDVLVHASLSTTTPFKRASSTSSSSVSANAAGGFSQSGERATTPRNIVDDKEWRRATLTTLFGGGNATRTAHAVVVKEIAGDSPLVTDTWVVGAAMGVGRARDMALDRKHAHMMFLPLAAVAAHVRRDGADVDPSAAPPPPSAARLAASAARCRADGRREPVVPRVGGGLCAPFPMEERRGGDGDGDGDAMERALRRAPAVIAARFALERGGGRSLARFTEKTPRAPSSPSSPGTHYASTTGSSEHVRREWNRAMCQCVVAAYATMVQHARTASPTLPAKTFYGLWPRAESMGLPAPPALRSDGRPIQTAAAARGNQTKTHPALELVVYPLYRELADVALFRSLGSAALVKPADGYFLPAGFAPAVDGDASASASTWSGGFGDGVARPLAASFIARHFPVLDAPASLRPELAAAGACAAAKELTASSLRKLLKSKPPPDTSTGGANLEALRTHVELIECATSDVVVADGAGTSGTPEDGDAGGARVHVQQDSLSGVLSAMSSAGFPLNEWLDAAGLGGSGGGSGGGSRADARAPPSVAVLNLAAVRDLSGVPVPVAGGGASSLGTSPLWLGSEDVVSLVPRLAPKFVSPTLSGGSRALAALFSHPQFRRVLYTGSNTTASAW